MEGKCIKTKTEEGVIVKNERRRKSRGGRRGFVCQ